MMFCQRIVQGMIFLAASVTFSAQAIYLESTIYDMPADKSFISKRIYNDGKRQNIYSISAVNIDRPGAGGEKRRAITDGELLFTPLNFSLAPASGEVFKIFYRGPQDDKERYYRILFREMPVTLLTDRQKGKESEAIPVIAMDTILVVRPRKLNFNYTLDEKSGILKNTGNTFFKVIVQDGCNSNDDDAKMLYLLPGETWHSPLLTQSNKKFIVALNKFIPAGEKCFENNQKDLWPQND